MPDFKIGDRIIIRLPDASPGKHGDYYNGDKGVITVVSIYNPDVLRVDFDTPSRVHNRPRTGYMVDVRVAELYSDHLVAKMLE